MLRGHEQLNISGTPQLMVVANLNLIVVRRHRVFFSSVIVQICNFPVLQPARPTTIQAIVIGFHQLEGGNTGPRFGLFHCDLDLEVLTKPQKTYCFYLALLLSLMVLD